MDFSQAFLLSAAVFAVTAAVDKAVPLLVGWKLQVSAFVIGIAMTFLVAYSSYGDTVTVGGKQLSDVNVAGLFLIGLLIAGGATALDRTYTAVSNVGQNQDGGG